MALDRNWRESKREEKRLRGKKKLLPQQATTEPALMEGVERTNTVVVRGAGQGQ